MTVEYKIRDPGSLGGCDHAGLTVGANRAGVCPWFWLEKEMEHVFKNHISFLPSLVAHRCYFRGIAATQIGRNCRWCCCSLIRLYSPVTQKGSVTQEFLSFPPWDLFPGPYWKRYQRKLGASDPSVLCFTVCFLLCLWFSLDLLQLWFILVSCSGICWVSCVFFAFCCITASLFSELLFLGDNRAFVFLLSAGFSDPGWLSTSCLTQEFLLPFLFCWKTTLVIGR